MIISLIGMSRTGKSHQSKILAQQGYSVFCMDDIIEQKLASYLIPLGYNGIADVSRWMGQPFDNQYVLTSAKYLELEEEAMNEVFGQIEILQKQLQNSDQTKIVLDTTGSVIYCSDQVLTLLKHKTTVVYLDTPQSVQDQAYKLYLSDPKPVYWGNSFYRLDIETNLEALGRCYPLLLKYRSDKYKQIADITIDYFELRNSNFSLEFLLQNIDSKKYF